MRRRLLSFVRCALALGAAAGSISACGSSDDTGTGAVGATSSGTAGGTTAAGSAGTGGSPGSGGSGGSGGGSNPADASNDVIAPGDGSGGSGGSGGADAAADTVAADAALGKFSFFVSSLVAMRRLSGREAGFGGDLRFGKADGLAGGDEICRQIAETSMPGSGTKGWRAFLSVTKDASGAAVNAIDRVGAGPWYDRRGRLVAMNKADLGMTRPKGADAIIINDLPNEDGVPNHAPDGTVVDNHDILTGSDDVGKLYNTDWSHTCHDWTSAVGADGKPRVGHSWPRTGGPGGRIDGGRIEQPPGGDLDNWMSALDEAGCAPGVNLVEMGPPDPRNPTVGSGGGYGGIYCFALVP